MAVEHWTPARARKLRPPAPGGERCSSVTRAAVSGPRRREDVISTRVRSRQSALGPTGPRTRIGAPVECQPD